MHFTGLSLIVAITAFIHFVLVTLHYLAACAVEDEANAILEQKKRDPLTHKRRINHRDRLASAKVNLRISVLVFGVAVLPSMMWSVSPWATGSAMVLLIGAGIFLGRSSRRNIQCANDVLEDSQSVTAKGFKSLQDAHSAPLVVVASENWR